MDHEETQSLPPELQTELDTLTLKMREHEAEMKAVIDRHSLAWKRMEAEPSELAAEELQLAERAMAVVAKNIEVVTAQIDKVLGDLGIDPDDLEEPLPHQKNRLWQKDLEPDTVPKDELEMEAAIERGLPQLLDYFPRSWVQRQLERDELLMRTRGLEPPFLLGGISAEPMLERERFGYGLALSIALIEEDPHFDMYEAPTLIPQIAILCESLGELQKVEGGIDKLRELRRAPGTEVDSRIYELLVAARTAEMGRKVSFIPTDPRSSTPDLRVHDMHFPVVIECKLQSRRAKVEAQAVLPFFYWKTREGSILSHRDDFPALLTACAMFPRRPKVNGERIEMTVNEEVYLMSQHLREAGIPTFLGFPRINSLSEFATDFECLWFSPNSKELQYTCHEISSSKGTTEHSALFGPFKDEKEIHGFIEANAIQQTWCSLLDVLFEVHSKISQEDIIRHRFLFGLPYKPVYFLMW